MHDDSDDFDIHHLASFANLDLDDGGDSMDSTRVRFNWGFHDGTRDASHDEPARDVSRHHDRLYAVAYLRGHQDFTLSGVRVDTSDDAWQAFTADVSAWRASSAAALAPEQPGMRNAPAPRMRM
ncbi:hypothetical protein AB4Y43_16945 [Paraburkholderia sp. BR10872]|uniref:hypothetical protein n=1 Tax=Paraburkholderia sp. BR10872 TaxID=3236989 RepID=UPI0034D28699